MVKDEGALMEVVVPQLRKSKLVRPKGEQSGPEGRGIRRLAKSYDKHLAIVVHEKKFKALSSGMTAGISGGHKLMGEGCWRAVPARRD